MSVEINPWTGILSCKQVFLFLSQVTDKKENVLIKYFFSFSNGAQVMCLHDAQIYTTHNSYNIKLINII